MRSTRIKPIISVFCLLLTLFIISACATSVDPNSPNLEKAEYFQLAYVALDNNDYDLAVNYYKAFKAKFPDDIEGNIWADYEIAFIYHKKGDDKTSLSLFQDLLKKYGENETDSMPTGPKILAEKVVKKIET